MGRSKAMNENIEEFKLLLDSFLRCSIIVLDFVAGLPLLFNLMIVYLLTFFFLVSRVVRSHSERRCQK